MDYVFFKKAVVAYRAYIVNGRGISRKTFMDRWRVIQSMQRIRCPR